MSWKYCNKVCFERTRSKKQSKGSNFVLHSRRRPGFEGKHVDRTSGAKQLIVTYTPKKNKQKYPPSSPSTLAAYWHQNVPETCETPCGAYETRSQIMEWNRRFEMKLFSLKTSLRSTPVLMFNTLTWKTQRRFSKGHEKKSHEHISSFERI
jgi:hypothetical protein